MPMGGNPWANAAASYGQDLDQFGQIKMQGMQQAAQAPLSLYDRFMSGYQRARQEAMQREEQDRKNMLADLQAQKLQYEQDKLRESNEVEAGVNSVYRESIDPTTGEIDPLKLTKGLANNGWGSYVPKYTQELANAQQAKLKLEEAKRLGVSSARGEVSKTLGSLAVGGNPLTVASVMQAIKGVSSVSGDHAGAAQEFMDSLPQGIGMYPPEEQAKILSGAIRQRIATGLSSDKQMDLTIPKPSIQTVGGRTDQWLTNPVTGEMTRGQSIGLTAQDQLSKIKQDVANGLLTPQEGAERQRKIDQPPQSILNMSTAMNDPNSMTAIRALAEQSIAQGRLVEGLGMGDNATKKLVIQEMGKIIQERGGNTNLAGNRGTYRADTGSLGVIQKQADAVEAFERTALNNFERYAGVLSKLTDTGSPLLNRPIRTVQSSIFGDPDIAAGVAAGRVAINEAAKILTNPNMTGVLTDEARREVEKIVPGGIQNATIAQALSVLNILKQDMGQRKREMNAQISIIKGRMGGGASGPSADTKINPSNGKTYYKHQDGKYYLEPPR